MPLRRPASYCAAFRALQGSITTEPSDGQLRTPGTHSGLQPGSGIPWRLAEEVIQGPALKSPARTKAPEDARVFTKKAPGAFAQGA